MVDRWYCARIKVNFSWDVVIEQLSRQNFTAWLPLIRQQSSRRAQRAFDDDFVAPSLIHLMRLARSRGDVQEPQDIKKQGRIREALYQTPASARTAAISISARFPRSVNCKNSDTAPPTASASNIFINPYATSWIFITSSTVENNVNSYKLRRKSYSAPIMLLFIIVGGLGLKKDGPTILKISCHVNDMDPSVTPELSDVLLDRNSILKRSDNRAMFSTLGTNCSFKAMFCAVKTSIDSDT
jgi:hypothetical protein